MCEYSDKNGEPTEEEKKEAQEIRNGQKRERLQFWYGCMKGQHDKKYIETTLAANIRPTLTPEAVDQSATITHCSICNTIVDTGGRGTVSQIPDNLEPWITQPLTALERYENECQKDKHPWTVCTNKLNSTRECFHQTQWCKICGAWRRGTIFVYAPPEYEQAYIPLLSLLLQEMNASEKAERV